MSNIKEKLAHLVKKSYLEVSCKNIEQAMKEVVLKMLKEEGCDMSKVDMELDGILDQLYFDLQEDAELSTFLQDKVYEICGAWLKDTKNNMPEYFDELF